MEALYSTTLISHISRWSATTREGRGAMITAKKTALVMLQCRPADGVLYQVQITYELSDCFGEDAIYGIQNGNLAISKERMTNGRTAGQAKARSGW